MDRSTRILLVVGFIGAALLGGILSPGLKPGGAEASPLQSFGLPTQLTTMGVPKLLLGEYTNEWAKLGDIDEFTVGNSYSLVEATFQGHLWADSLNTSRGAIFELRVDDQPPLAHTGQVLIFHSVDPMLPTTTFVAYWQNLEAGTHTASLWVKAASEGFGKDAQTGGWGSDSLIIKEYLPSGTYYMPVVQR